MKTFWGIVGGLAYLAVLILIGISGKTRDSNPPTDAIIRSLTNGFLLIDPTWNGSNYTEGYASGRIGAVNIIVPVEKLLDRKSLGTLQPLKDDTADIGPASKPVNGHWSSEIVNTNGDADNSKPFLRSGETNFLTIELSNRYVVTLGERFPLIQFTDEEWNLITNHMKRDRSWNRWYFNGSTNKTKIDK